MIQKKHSPTIRVTSLATRTVNVAHVATWKFPAVASAEGWSSHNG